MELFLQLIENGIAFGTMIALITLGFALIFGVTRIFHIAHGAVYVFAAYMMYLFWILLGLNFFLSLILDIVLSSALGVLIELRIYRQMRKIGATPMVIMIASMGLLIVIQNMISIFFGSDLKSLHKEAVSKSLSFGPVMVEGLHIAMVAIALVLYVLVELFLRKTKFGKSIRAVANTPSRAFSVGIDVNFVYLLTFAVGSALAVIPAIFIPLDTALHPFLGFQGILYAFIAMIVGGLGSYKGAAFGGIFLGIVQNLGIWKLPSEWGEGIAFGILLIFIIFKPMGFFGRKIG